MAYKIKAFHVKSYVLNKNDICDTWDLDLLDLTEFVTKHKGSYGNILVVIDNFSEYAITLVICD